LKDMQDKKSNFFNGKNWFYIYFYLF
jgi:hypothetical protein